MWLSAEVVFGDADPAGFRVLGGFRLADGRPLDEAAIATARDRVDALPYTDPAKAPSENVLAILRAAARQPGELDALLLSEVVERLRHARAQRLRPAGHRRAGRASLGLDEDEAGLIAAAMPAGDALGALRQQVEDELTGGQAAQRAAAGRRAARRRPAARRGWWLDAEVDRAHPRGRSGTGPGRPEQAARAAGRGR